MITTGPFTIAAGDTQTLTDPYSSSGQATHIQIANASPLVLTVTSGAEIVSIPADSAATCTLSALSATVAASGSGAGQYRVSWLMAQDALPIPNGPLTSEQVVIGNVPAVTISGTPNVSVASGTIDIGTAPVLDVTGSTVDLASGTTVDATVSGSVDASITNASIPVTGSVDATISGPVGISGGTIYVVNPFTGESLPSAKGTTTTGNATLSSTDYNLVSWDAVPLPAGSSGNLVYDSNLTNAIAAVGPTWQQNGSTVGTADGDFTALNAGTDSAEWQYLGTGAAQSFIGPSSAAVAVTPGATYEFSAVIDVPSGTTIIDDLGILLGPPATPTSYYMYAYANVVGTQTVSVSWVCPSGVTEVSFMCYQNGAVVPAGSAVTWSQIQLTETSAVQTYEPGPLWTYPVYGRGGLLAETTALAYEDTGADTPDTSTQPPSFNSTAPQLPAPAAPSVTPEGTAGTTTYDYQVTVRTSQASTGATRLAPSPGTNIGTMDIGPGNTIEIAAGTAEIGTVDLASGATVDANITNATLDIAGPVTIAAATQTGSTFGVAEASGTNVATVTVTASAGTGVSATMASPPSGNVIVIHQVVLQFETYVAGASVVAEIAGGSQLSNTFYSQSSGDALVISFAGIAAGSGDGIGIALTAPSSAGATVSAMMVYSLAAS